MPPKSVNRVREILASGCEVPQEDASDISYAADPHMHGEKTRLKAERAEKRAPGTEPVKPEAARTSEA